MSQSTGGADTVRELPLGRHAVVLGAGMAGLLAAAALAPVFPAVTVLDADQEPQGAEPRAGVPQGNHLHAMLVGGQRAVEELVPGFADDLKAAGAPLLTLGTDMALITEYGQAPRTGSELRAFTASRGLFEWVVRRRIQALADVEVRWRHRATGLDCVGARVTTVRVRLGDAGQELSLPADLVVDATGRGSRTPHWLEEHGFGRITEVTVDPRLAYASRVYRIPGPAPDWRACYLLPTGPRQPRGAAMACIEGNRWIVSLNGVASDRPTATEEDYLPFTGGLASPVLGRLLKDAEPLSPVRGTHATANRRRHPEHLPGLPENLVLLGDAVCALNPVYAQGMTAAAFGARLLGQLAAHHPPGGFAHRFQRQLARSNDLFWSMTTSADHRFPTTIGAPPTLQQRLLGRGMGAVLAAGARSARVHAAFLDVLNMVAPPTILLAPRAWPALVTACLPRIGTHAAP